MTLLKVRHRTTDGSFTNEFIDANGKRVWLLGYGGVCCGAGSGPTEVPTNGWPWISEPYLRELAAHGGNFVHIRVGPNSKVLEPRPDMRPYLDGPNGKPDMNQWNPVFWANLNKLISLAYSLGVYVEIDVLDAWELKEPSQSAFPAPYNTVEVLRRAPAPVHQRFINKLVHEIGANVNVLWQMSNESGVPMEACTLPDGSQGQCPIVNLAWDLGIADAIRIQEDLDHYPYHLRSTNAGLKKLDNHGDIDYVNTHQCSAPEQPKYTGKPITVNECNGVGYENFRSQLALAQQRGTYYHLWVGDMSEADRLKSLDLIAEYRKTHP